MTIVSIKTGIHSTFSDAVEAALTNSKPKPQPKPAPKPPKGSA